MYFMKRRVPKGAETPEHCDEHCDVHCDQDCYDDDPVINIHFSSEAEIDNCLSLATISTVGPNNDVPRLARGIVSTTI